MLKSVPSSAKPTKGGTMGDRQIDDCRQQSEGKDGESHERCRGRKTDGDDQSQQSRRIHGELIENNIGDGFVQREAVIQPHPPESQGPVFVAGQQLRRAHQ